MKKIVKTLFFATVILVSSCESGADLESTNEYLNNGLSFDYPGNWKVTEDIESDGVRFVFIESPGAGIMKIEIYNAEESFELKEFVKLDIEDLISQFPALVGVEKPDLIMNIEKTIGEELYKGLMYEIDISVLGIAVPHITEAFSVTTEHKTAYLSGQVATEDSHSVSGGFDLILSSVKLGGSE